MIPDDETKYLFDKGGKIILPKSALNNIVAPCMTYPLQLKIVNPDKISVTHCGVSRFTAEEGKVYLPKWLMLHLLVEVGNPILVERVKLPDATLCRLQLQCKDFLEPEDPKAVVNRVLKGFNCLTVGDMFEIDNLKFTVLQTEPTNAVSIIERDIKIVLVMAPYYQETENLNTEK